jgi:hypothetical protein
MTKLYKLNPATSTAISPDTMGDCGGVEKVPFAR